MADLKLHKDTGYDFGHVMKDGMDPEQPVNTSLTYKQVSRIVNVLEDLHAQMQNSLGERFKDYDIEQYEKIDITIRDHMANLALSLEAYHQSERNSE